MDVFSWAAASARHGGEAPVRWRQADTVESGAMLMAGRHPEEASGAEDSIPSSAAGTGWTGQGSGTGGQL